MESIFDTTGDFDDARLLRLAEQLAWCRPLTPYPGWIFDKDWDNPGIGYRLRRLLWCEARDRRLAVPFVFEWYDDLEVELYLGNDQSKQLFIGGCFDPNEFAFLHETLRPGMTFVDVGANEGLYSLFAARRVGSEGTVWAVEPSPREIGRLRRNLERNRLDQAIVVETALGDQPGTGTLSVASYGHEGQNTLSSFIYDDVELAETVDVPVKRLDALVAEHGLERLDVLKIDAEGADAAVLLGAGDLLAEHRPTLLVEVQDAALALHGSSEAALLDHLRSLGYALFGFGPDGRPSPWREHPGTNLIAIPATPDLSRSSASADADTR